MRIFLNKYCNFQAKPDECKESMPLKTTSCHITYLCRKGLQGNIVALIDNNGNTVVEYKYDAWGNHKVVDANGNEVTSSNHLGNLNPFRYRGYYYDVETGLYFLQTRYYDPEVGRFLNRDSVSYADPQTINGLNLYTYCGNNPVMYIDPYGKFALTTFGVLAIIGITSAAIVLGGGAQLASNALAGENGSDLWRGVAGAALGSGANVLALCLLPLSGGASIMISAVIGASIQTGVDTLENAIRGEEISLEQIALDLGINFATTSIGNLIGAKCIPTNSGWFKPKKFLSVFFKPYGQKILLQTAIGAGISGVVNLIRKTKGKLFNLLLID